MKTFKPGDRVIYRMRDYVNHSGQLIAGRGIVDGQWTTSMYRLVDTDHSDKCRERGPGLWADERELVSLEKVQDPPKSGRLMV